MNTLWSFLTESDTAVKGELPITKSALTYLSKLLCADADSYEVEDYTAGYPRYTALLSAHSPWFLCRRFDKIRARLLLLKQGRLSQLEQQLEQVDRQELSLLFLGKSRCDRNPQRKAILSEIEVGLEDYDKFVERTSRMLSLGLAHHRDVESLQNWVDGTGCLAREETAYLAHDRELIALAPVADNATRQLEYWTIDKVMRFWSGLRPSRFNDISTDPNVSIYRGHLLRRTIRGSLLLLITLLLMMPIVACNLVNATSLRIFIVTIATILYLLILAWLTKSGTMELTVAGVTYATVLTVFVSGSGST